jgi:hypothetical protein
MHLVICSRIERKKCWDRQGYPGCCYILVERINMHI